MYVASIEGGNFHKALYIHIDGHESKPAISILAIVQESRKTFAFRYFSSYTLKTIVLKNSTISANIVLV